MTHLQSDYAEWTAVTSSQPGDDERAALGAELDSIRVNLGLSNRALADKIEVDRETLRRVFMGDPTVRANKLRMVERRVRALDDEMSSERATESQGDEPGIVELRLPNIAGSVVVSGTVGDVAKFAAAVDRLIRGALDDPGDAPSD
jgi:hypothetical protein